MLQGLSLARKMARDSSKRAAVLSKLGVSPKVSSNEGAMSDLDQTGNRIAELLRPPNLLNLCHVALAAPGACASASGNLEGS